MIIDGATAKQLEDPYYYKLSLREKYKKLAEYAHAEQYTIYYSHKCVAPFWHFSHGEYHNWLKWVNKNICLNLYKDTLTTISVKIRIATGLLNSIKELKDDEKRIIHDNLIQNIYAEYWRIIEDELPF